MIIVVSIVGGLTQSLIFATLYEMQQKSKKLEEQNKKQQELIEDLAVEIHNIKKDEE